MKVVITAPAVTYVDGIAQALTPGQEHDFPKAKADALIAAGLAEEPKKAAAPKAKKVDAAPENK